MKISKISTINNLYMVPLLILSFEMFSNKTHIDRIYIVNNRLISKLNIILSIILNDKAKNKYIFFLFLVKYKDTIDIRIIIDVLIS